MKNLTSLAILLAAVIGFMPAKPAEANPHHHKHNSYHTTSYHKSKPTYHKVYYYSKPKPTYYKVYYYQPKPTYRVYQPKQHSTYHKVHYYR
jgi:hypothetical protein